MQFLTSVCVIYYVATFKNGVSGHPHAPITTSTDNSFVTMTSTTPLPVTTFRAFNPDTPIFRPDYTRMPDLRAFYKLHLLPHTWYEAIAVCEAEGATLNAPESELEVEHVKAMMHSLPSRHVAIFVGFHNLFGSGDFVNLKGVPVEAVFHSWASGEPNNKGGDEHCVVITRHGLLNDVPCHSRFHFICKKTFDASPYNTACQTYDLDYKYDEQQAKCYKVHVELKSWHAAYAVCSAEGSYLAVINSDSEAALLVSHMAEHPPRTVIKQSGGNAFHIGFHDLFRQGDFRTIQGDKIRNSGYNNWSEGKPDCSLVQSIKRCGSVLRNGSLDDILCELPAPFICEHEIETSISKTSSPKPHIYTTTSSSICKTTDCEQTSMEATNGDTLAQ